MIKDSDQSIFVSGGGHARDRLVYGANYMTMGRGEMVPLEDYREGKQRVKTAQEKVLEAQTGMADMNMGSATSGGKVKLDNQFISQLTNRVKKSGGGYRYN